MQRFRRVAERAYSIGALAILFCAFGLALDTSKLKPSGYVNDFAHVIDAGSAAQIEAYCGSVERATGAQFAIVTVDTLEDDSVEDVAVRLFKEWGIGKKGTDEGLLVLLAIKDRKNRVEVGYGLEPVITDADAGSVLRGIRPILRQGNYGGALLAAAQQFGQKVADAKGVTIEGQPRPQRPSGNSGGGGGFFGIVIFFVILMFIFRALSGRGGRGGPRGGSGMGGFLTGMILGNMLGGGRRGGWSGGGFGGGGGGWGGGGGFGGFGGGSSGGGGASGGW